MNECFSSLSLSETQCRPLLKTHRCKYEEFSYLSVVKRKQQHAADSRSEFSRPLRVKFVELFGPGPLYWYLVVLHKPENYKILQNFHFEAAQINQTAHAAHSHSGREIEEESSDSDNPIIVLHEMLQFCLHCGQMKNENVPACCSHVLFFYTGLCSGLTPYSKTTHIIASSQYTFWIIIPEMTCLL